MPTSNMEAEQLHNRQGRQSQHKHQQSSYRMSSWWPWAKQPVKPMRATDASQTVAMKTHFLQLLDHTEPPQVFKASDVAKLLTERELAEMGYETWKDAIPAVYELAWEFRGMGACHLVQNDRILPDDADILDRQGPVRIMRKKNYRD